MSAMVSIGAVTLTDERVNTTKKFARLISPTVSRGAMHAKLLSVTYEKAASGAQEIDVKLNSFRVLAVPEFAFTVKALGLDMLEIVNKSTAKRDEIIKKQQEAKKLAEAASSGSRLAVREPTPATPATPATPSAARDASSASTTVAEPAALSATVTIIEPQICLVENPEIKDSRAVILLSTIKVNFVQVGPAQKIKLDLTRAELYKCRLSSENTTLVSIISPFSMIAQYEP